MNQFYECEICGYYHPVDWHGDCKKNRFTAGDLDDKFGNSWEKHSAIKELTIDHAVEFDADYLPILYNRLTADLLSEGKIIGQYERVRISRRGENSWAIIWGNNCLGKDGFWEYEPFPSNREEEYLQYFRFESAQKAFTFYEKWKNKAVNIFKETGAYEM
jgi:hypothetical protein